ncbi:hypothetical protein D3C78_1168100 [compost metagenome]
MDALQRTIAGEHFRVIVLVCLDDTLVVAVVDVGLRIDHTGLQRELGERVAVQVHQRLTSAVLVRTLQDGEAIQHGTLALDQLGVGRSGGVGGRCRQTQTEVVTLGAVETGFDVEDRVTGGRLAVVVGQDTGGRAGIADTFFTFDLFHGPQYTVAGDRLVDGNQFTVGTFEGTVRVALVLIDGVFDDIYPDTQGGSLGLFRFQAADQCHGTSLQNLLQHGGLVAQERRACAEGISAVDGVEARTTHQQCGVVRTPGSEQRSPRQEDRQVDDFQRLTLTAHIFETEHLSARQRRSHRNRRHCNVSHGN